MVLNVYKYGTMSPNNLNPDCMFVALSASVATKIFIVVKNGSSSLHYQTSDVGYLGSLYQYCRRIPQLLRNIELQGRIKLKAAQRFTGDEDDMVV